MVRMYNYVTKVEKLGIGKPAVCTICQLVHDRLDTHLIVRHRLVRQSDEFKQTFTQMTEETAKLLKTIYFPGPHRTGDAQGKGITQLIIHSHNL